MSVRNVTIEGPIRPVRQSTPKFLASASSRFVRTPLRFLAIPLAFGIGAIVWHSQFSYGHLVEIMALRSAALYTDALVEFRTLYTSEVVKTVKGEGIPVTHDYATRNGAIPLPGTLSMLLAERIGERGTRVKARLYSPYPFPWREETSNLNEDFAVAAWAFFQENPGRAFIRFEDDVDGAKSLRYATADLMRPSCVECHNTHPDTPKGDWKVGDVRGVLEVVYPLGPVAQDARLYVWQSLGLQIAMLVLALSALAFVFGKLRTRTDETQQAKARFQDFVETAADWFWELDANLRFTYVSVGHEHASGVPAKQVLGQTAEDLFAAQANREPDKWQRRFEDMKLGRPIESIEFVENHPDGKRRVLRLNGKPVFDERGVFTGYRGTGLDVTEAHNLAQELAHQASHDALTGLVNRREFERRLQRLLETAKAEKTENALCYLDLDEFKVVNDTCGHISGDQLLCQLGESLKNQMRVRDTLARLGGDEFGVLLEHCPLQQAELVAEKLRETVGNFRFQCEGKSFHVGVSIGLVPITEGSGNMAEVTRAADAACFAAKDQGRNRVHIYHEEDVELAKRHGEMAWVARINQALAENRFRLYVQPIVPVSPDDSESLHYEVLLRMEDEEGQIVPPGAFLPAAERYNLSTKIDRWVIGAVFEWLANHPQQLERTRSCAINLSGASLTDHEILATVARELEKWNIPPGKICFEVTETAAIANLAKAALFILTLKELGCRFALDDFGSGLSSFTYLKNLPVDYLKIDGAFVKNMIDDPVDSAMVKTINEIGKVMSKQTIAEFVENEAIREKLQEIGVDYAQGYGIGRPHPIDEMTKIEEPRNKSASPESPSMIAKTQPRQLEE